ncbi:2OG-Fe(II) oxygenase [Noviherbaspirillum aerium]|uniref:2OG-Fe(II) oxygenase n=1 Tax=Noviherbaspirillum aerium TaxID=2588497 RepID=UPI001CEF91B3|nr:2OG-Fe(II) oxygenase [Noviherbaspirillum aerium]
MMNTPHSTLSMLASLPAEWQAWVKENVARGCEPEGMADIMVRDGHFKADLARLAIAEASGHAPAAVRIRPHPRIEANANVIQAADRPVNVLFRLQSPEVILFGNLLSEEECDALIAYTQQRLERSPVVGDTDGSTQIHAHRTSRGAMLQRGETELVTRIENRLAALIHWPVENGEGLQVLSYEKGNEYRPHFDWFDPNVAGPRKHLERGGQRVATIVMYLSDVEEGGGTSFPKIGLHVQPKKGSAVYFANTSAAGEVDHNTLHAGEPVERGIKYVATKWLREGEFK